MISDVLDHGRAMLTRIADISARLTAAQSHLDAAETVEVLDELDAILAEPEPEIDDGIPKEYLGTPSLPHLPPTHLAVVPPLDPKGGNSNTRDNRKSWIGLAGISLPLMQTGDVAAIAADRGRSMTIEDADAAGYAAGMITWIVEFEGQQKPLDDVWSPEMAVIVGPVRHQVAGALDAAADPDELEGLRVIIFAEDGEWGFRLAGSPTAVNYAIALIGLKRDIRPTTN